MTDKQIIIDDYFRKIVDINGKIVDYEIKNSEVSKLVQKIEKYNSYIKLKEQECEELKKIIDEAKNSKLDLKSFLVGEAVQNEYEEQLDQLKGELKSAKELREYTYNCCKQAGEELAKNSFEWDGKEKNLVVQAMELNERYDQLKEQLEAYKIEADEGKEVNAELKAENKELRNFHINLVGVKECEIKELLKLKQTLTEIKEIAETCSFTDSSELLLSRIDQILQKISEVEE